MLGLREYNLNGFQPEASPLLPLNSMGFLEEASLRNTQRDNQTFGQGNLSPELPGIKQSQSSLSGHFLL